MPSPARTTQNARPNSLGQEAKQDMSFQKRWLPILLGGLFVVAMVWASVALSMPEVLFPETTAILCGAWI